MTWLGRAYVVRVLWSATEDAAIRAARYADPPVTWRELSFRLGRSEGSVAARWHRLRELAGEIGPVGPKVRKTLYIPDAVAEQRAQRARLAEERELAGATTAMLCGDPLPGYSALDREPAQAQGHDNQVTLANSMALANGGTPHQK